MDDLRRLAEAATPGPWFRVTEGNESVERMGHKVLHELLVPLPDGIPPSTDGTYVRTGDDSKNVAFIGNGPRQTDNGDYIAALNPHRVLALLDRLAALEEALDTIARWLDERITVRYPGEVRSGPARMPELVPLEWARAALEAAPAASAPALEEVLRRLVGVLSEPYAVGDKTWPDRHAEALAEARAALAGTPKP